jgi:hypothetical protein
MCRLLVAALAFSLSLLVTACQTQDVSAPQGSGSDDLTRVPSLPTSSASLDCRYQPSGLVEIPVNTSKTFSPSAGNCEGAYGTLSPGDGRVGFGVAAPCATFETQEAGGFALFKVRRCLVGSATFRIYTNSSKTTLLQTITLVHN